MKKLFVLAMFVPIVSFGQKFEISEQAGYSFTSAQPKSELTSIARPNKGISNQITLGYYPVNWFSVNAFYELSFWGTRLNAYGISPELSNKHFFAGIDVKRENFTPLYFTGSTTT